ncbi:MAG: acyl-CoA dehydrogenase family protein [Zoogloea oleivorans]|jgi:alkylation response protein AidB-like acyl-CoA dehydrogenase|uniref:acyl-CoA dehydrogenase family protein n=1 Tax=Zoogloea oleivorans TaxID=1552750 RepID=UPI002A35CB30|nr:acyl-CoA dehydrogenase family protein [Zoogloea oleivorans]MDY0038301.1 acyl-CoA dehydrogenase family protein [Zoogloea oleivorans]
MELTETSEEKAFRAEVREFVAKNLPTDIRERVMGLRRVEREDYVRWQRILHARGWGAVAWPKEYGGTGLNAVYRSIFDEECHVGGAPRQIPMGVSMLAPVLLKFGTEEQRRQYLPRILTLDDWWCQGYSEPGAGSDLASLKCRAERKGDVYVINGQKTWTTYAQWATKIFCLVRTSSEGKPQQGISFVLADMNTPGISVQPIKTLDQGHDINSVFFDNVEVPVANLVGEEGAGWDIAKYLLGHERTGIAGLGLCKRLLRQVKHHATQQKHRGLPLIEDRRFRDRVATLEMDVTAHEWAMRRLLSLEGGDAGAVASVLKIRGSEIQQEATALLLECAGPHALPYLPDALEQGWKGDTAAGENVNALAPSYFDFRKSTIYGGTTEIQKTIIAKSILG